MKLQKITGTEITWELCHLYPPKISILNQTTTSSHVNSLHQSLHNTHPITKSKMQFTKMFPHLPQLGDGAAYMILNSPRNGNALSLNVLRDLKRQLIEFNTSPKSGRQLFLPPFKPPLLSRLERSMARYKRKGYEDEYAWLVSSTVWEREREGLPRAIVLASGNDGPNFCSGHNLREIRESKPEEVRELFRTCAELMSLIRRSPVLITTRVKGHAHGAGVQLAFATDLPLAHANLYKNILPGKTLGFPCTSPGAVLGRSVLSTPSEVMGALIDGQIKYRLHYVTSPPGTFDPEQWVKDLDSYLMKKVDDQLSVPTQPMAMAKWATYTQMSLRGQNYLDADGNEVEGCGGDGFEDAVAFAGRVMALHAQGEEAEKGMDAFIAQSEARNLKRKFFETKRWLEKLEAEKSRAEGESIFMEEGSKAEHEVKLEEEAKAEADVKAEEQVDVEEEVKVDKELKSEKQLDAPEEIQPDGESKLEEGLKAQDEVKLGEEAKAEEDVEEEEQVDAQEKVNAAQEVQPEEESKPEEETNMDRESKMEESSKPVQNSS